MRGNKLAELKASIRTGDLLFTFDTESLTSKLISFFDRGPWSHCGMCSGEGTIIEATTAGVVERPIEVYLERSNY